IGVRIAPVTGSGVTPAWIWSVRKPMCPIVAPLPKIPLVGSAEAVADRANRRDPGRPFLAEFGAYPPDVDVDGSGAAVVVVPPHLREELLAAPYPARVLDQEPQQFVFHVGEVDRRAPEGRLVGERVQFQVLEAKDLLGLVGRGVAAQSH